MEKRRCLLNHKREISGLRAATSSQTDVALHNGTLGSTQDSDPGAPISS